MENIKNILVENALNENHNQGVFYKGKNLRLFLQIKKQIPPFDFENKEHGIKFLSLSKFFLKEYAFIKDLRGVKNAVKDFKDYKELCNFFFENNIYTMGVDMSLKEKIRLRANTLTCPNFGFLYVERSYIEKFFNLKLSFDREHREKQIKEYEHMLETIFKTHFIGYLENYLNGEVYTLLIDDEIRICYGEKNIKEILDLELSA